MKQKIFSLLKSNGINFKIGLSDYYDYLILSSNDRITINCKTYYDNLLNPYYSLIIKVICDNLDKFQYSCFLTDLDRCIIFLENTMYNLGVFCDYDK